MNAVSNAVKETLSRVDLMQDLSCPIAGLFPREDQIETSKEAIEWLATESDKGKVIELPTGGGKTMIAQMIIRWLTANTNLTTTFLVSRKDLLIQTKSAMEKTFGKRSVNITQGSKHENHSGARVRVAMEQTVASKIKNNTAQEVINSIKQSDIVFIDECHHTYYQSFIDQVFDGGGRVIGLSATPDDWRLLDYFESVKIIGVPQIELETMNPRVLATPVMLFYSQESRMTKAMSGIVGLNDRDKVRYGLIRETIASEIFSAEERVVQERKEKGLNQFDSKCLRWMIKVTRVDDAIDLAQHLSNSGIPARSFTSGDKSKKKDIDSIFSGTSPHRVAIVVHMYTMGYDHHGIQGLILTNETGYPTFVQSIGRVLRTGYTKEKDEAYILDMAGNWSIHKKKYLERRVAPNPIIEPKVELEEGEEGTQISGPGRPNAEVLGDMAVLTLPGISKTQYASMNKAEILAYCANEATEHVQSSNWINPSNQVEFKNAVLKRALSSYWFITDTNIIKRGSIDVQKEAANQVIENNQKAYQIWKSQEEMPPEILKRLLKARRRFSKSRRNR